MSQIQTDLLVAAPDVDDLTGRGRCGADESFAALESLLKYISGKESIFVCKLEINPPRSFIVIEGLG